MMNKNSSPDTKRSITLQVTAIAAAIVFAAVAFLPLLGHKGRIATFMFYSDAFDLWLPQFNLLQTYVQQGVFQGLDYFTHNGSAEWFLRANLTVYFPPYLIVALLFPIHDVASQAWIVIFIEFLCSICSLYFSVLLAGRFFGFSKSLSVFLAVGYTFSWHYLVQINYVPFAFIAWIMPAVIYYSLASAVSPNLRNFSSGAFATFCLLTAGYLPLSLQALALSGLIVGFFLLNERSLWPRPRQLFRAALGGLAPVAIAILVTSPWLLAIVKYSEQTIHPIYKNNIAYSAFDYAEMPHSLLRAISGNLNIPGPFFEFSANVGLLLTTIFLLFVMVSRADIHRWLSLGERRTIWFGLSVFLVSWLIIYGSNSALSALFYFFVPVASFSHLYQRYLPLAQLFLLISSAQMLRVILLVEQPRLERTLLGLAALLVVGLSVLAGLNLNKGDVGFSEEFVVEAFYVAIFLLALVAIRGRAVVWVALLAMWLPALDNGYKFATLPELSFEVQQPKVMPLTPAAVEAFDAQLRSFIGHKDVLKVVNVTPGVHGYLPVNYPWFRAHDLTVSTYSGYDWHVGVPLGYREMNPMIVASDGELRFNPNPHWVAATGADVIIYDPKDPHLALNLQTLIDRSRPAVSIPYYGGNFVMAPLLQSHAPKNPAADNGYFRLAAEGAIENFVTNRAGSFDFEVDATTAGALQYLFWPSERLEIWVNDVQIEPFLNPEGILSIPVDSGSSVVKVRYENRLLNLFLIFYALFVVGLALVVLWTIIRAVVAWRQGRAAGSTAYVALKP